MTHSRPFFAALSFLILALAGCDQGGSDLPSEPEFRGSVTGSVTADQVGVEGVTVRLTGGTLKEIQSSSSGTFSFQSLPAGTYQVSLIGIPEHVEFSTTSQAASLQKGAGNTKVNFPGSVKRDGIIFGQATLAGLGFEGGTVTLSGSETHSTVTDAQGAFSFSGLKRGKYQATLSGYDPLLHDFAQNTQNTAAKKAPGTEIFFHGMPIPQPPLAPADLSATADSPNSALLGWTDASSDETRFEVHRKAGTEGSWGMIGAPGPDVTAFEDVGLQPATQYTYRVRSCNDAGCSEFTGEAAATTPDVPPETPTGLAAGAAGPYSVDLSWTPASLNEDRFEVERRVGASEDWTSIHTLGPGVSSHSDGDLSSNTTYRYRVRACNAVGCSGYSAEADATTDEIPPVAPVSPSASATGATSIFFSWVDASNNETGFEVQRLVGTGGTWESLGTTSAGTTSFTDSGLTPDTPYTYRVRACNTAGCSDFSAEVGATTQALPPDAPTSLSATASGPETVSLSWTDGSTNEARFEVERKPASGGSWAGIGSTDPNTDSFEAAGLSPATGYAFRIRACNDVGCSAYSNVATATTNDVPPNAPSGLGASATGPTSINLSWTDRSANETAFRVERKEGPSGPWTRIDTEPANTKSYSDTGLTPSTAYTYRIEACNAEGCSPYSNEAGTSTHALPPTTPTGLSATATGSTTVTVDWTDESDDETSFRVERKTGAGGTYTLIGTVGANSPTFGDTGLSYSTTYFYRVSACHSGGCSSPSNEDSATTEDVPPSAPASLSATATGAETIDLGWTDNANNEAGFKVERKTDAGVDPFAVVATTGPNATSLTDSGLSASTAYRYRVFAYNGAGDSPTSNEATETTWAGTGPNLTVDAMYITQSTQTLVGDVPLVANRDGYLRVFAIASEANAFQPDVRVRFYHSGGLVHTATLSAPGASTPLATDESNLSYSWNMSVPGALIQLGLSVLADVDPTNAIAEGNEADNDFPAGGSPQAVDVRTTATFDVTFVPVRQNANGLVGNVTGANASQFMDVAMRMLPIVQADLTVHAEYVTDAPALESNNGNGSWSTILGEIASLRVAEGSTGYYYGVVKTSYNSGVAGMGYIGWPISIGWDRLPSGSGVAAHEWGHNFAIRHAPGCGAGNPDASYPYANGKIGVWGLDLATLGLKSPNTHYDFMTYCSTDWISDYNYKKILEYRQIHDGGGAPPQPEPSLLVWGRVEADRIILEPAFQITTSPVLPDGSGAYRLEAVDQGGQTLYSGSFDPIPVPDDPQGNGHFAFAIPMRMLDGTGVEGLQVTGGGRLDGRRMRGQLPAMASPTDPVVSPAGGGSVEISWDDALYPMALVRDAETGQVLSFARSGRIVLPTNTSEIEITLSDGVRSPRRILRRIR